MLVSQGFQSQTTCRYKLIRHLAPRRQHNFLAFLLKLFEDLSLQPIVSGSSQRFQDGMLRADLIIVHAEIVDILFPFKMVQKCLQTQIGRRGTIGPFLRVDISCFGENLINVTTTQYVWVGRGGDTTSST